MVPDHRPPADRRLTGRPVSRHLQRRQCWSDRIGSYRIRYDPIRSDQHDTSQYFVWYRIVSYRVPYCCIVPSLGFSFNITSVSDFWLYGTSVWFTTRLVRGLYQPPFSGSGAITVTRLTRWVLFPRTRPIRPERSITWRDRPGPAMAISKERPH